jgi:hypothetical protein
MKLKSLKLFALVAAAVSLFAACDKNTGSLNGAGQTIVKLPEGAEEKVARALDFKSGFVPIVLLDVRRDAPNSGELNKTITVKIKNDPTILAAYNSAHGTSFQQLPAAAYRVNAANPFNGTEWTVTFNSGEHAKPILIDLDVSLLDLSKQYALGFTITDASGAKISNGLASALVEVGAKNKYDGIYTVVSGLVTRYLSPGVPANDALSGPVGGNLDVSLVTVGANAVAFQGSGGPVGLMWANGSNSGVAGIDGLRATIDPATNLVTMSSSGNASLVNWPGKINRYDPATKTFYLAFHWNPTANKREYEVVLKYKGPR